MPIRSSRPNRVVRWHKRDSKTRYAIVFPDDTIKITIEKRVLSSGKPIYAAYHDIALIPYSTFTKLKSTKAAAEIYVERKCNGEKDRRR